MKTKKNLLLAATFFGLSLVAPSGFAQGSLTPPGPPAPTMKTLSQIEPRTPISSLPITISASGSYYVTTNLSASTAVDGITITANNVSIDLNGFVLTGFGGANSAVTASSTLFNLAIRNGTIQNWGTGVNLPGADNSLFENLQLYGNTAGAGLIVADNCKVLDCVASGNFSGIIIHDGGIVKDCIASSSSSNGITAGSGAALSGCVARSNAAWGIIASNNCAIHDSVASYNSLSQVIPSYGGILAADNSSVIGCCANNNLYFINRGTGIQTGNNSLVKNCTASGQYNGIQTLNYSIIQDCIVSSISPENNGIVPGNSCVVRGCIVTADYAIQVGNSSLVEGNLTTGLLVAPISVYGTNNTVIHNNIYGTPAVSASSALNVIGTVETDTSANPDKNPHANFTP